MGVIEEFNNICSKYFVLDDFVCNYTCTKNQESKQLNNTNLLLTEREGRTVEYWPEVVAVRTERSDVRTKTTEGQYSPVARLVSSLLYGTRNKLVYIKKRTSGHLNSKGIRRDVFLMTRATQKEQTTVPRVWKQIY